MLAAYLIEHAPTVARPDLITYAIARLEPFFGAMHLADIKAGPCRAYVVARMAAGVSDQTARRELEVLRAAIQHYHREHGLDGAAPPRVTLPAKSPARQRWLTRAEAAALIRAARRHPRSSHVARLVLLGIYTGTRPGAMLALHWLPATMGGHVDLDAGVIHRQPPARPQSRTKRQTPVRIPDRLRGHLERWRAADMAAGITRVVHFEGRGITKLRRSWTSVRGAAGLGRDVVPHTLRHTCATWLMQAGIDRFEAAGFLGMTADTLETVYGHHHPDFQRAAASANPRFPGHSRDNGATRSG